MDSSLSRSSLTWNQYSSVTGKTTGAAGFANGEGLDAVERLTRGLRGRSEADGKGTDAGGSGWSKETEEESLSSSEAVTVGGPHDRAAYSAGTSPRGERSEANDQILFK